MKIYVGDWNARPIGVAVDPSVFNMVHPRDFKEIISQYRRDCPDVDLWTNNPYVISEFPPEEVFVCCLDNNGKSVCKPLTEHPKYKHWKDEMNTGELWSLFGESWVLE